MAIKIFLIILLSFLLSSSYAFANSNTNVQEKKSFLTIQPAQIDSLTANHKQGSISFKIKNVYYFYYIKTENHTESILATSAVLNDLKSTKKITIRHEAYGLHRKITNLLMFF